MLNAFVCGSFHLQEEDGACSSPRKSSKRSKDSRDNNPYSTRGLDKFSSLLADLDQRRQKIYSQMRPHDISFVRFRYSNTHDFVPIVVKVKKNKDKKKHNKSQELLKIPVHSDQPLDHNKSATEVTDALEERKQPLLLESDKRAAKKKKKKKNKSTFSWNVLKLPSFYLPVVIILILVFLSVFGRSVATLCTCVMWYLVPTILNDSSQPRKISVKKKDYVRGLSEKKMAVTGRLLLSPTSADSGASSDKTSGKHSHQKS